MRKATSAEKICKNCAVFIITKEGKRVCGSHECNVTGAMSCKRFIKSPMFEAYLEEQEPPPKKESKGKPCKGCTSFCGPKWCNLHGTQTTKLHSCTSYVSQASVDREIAKAEAKAAKR